MGKQKTWVKVLIWVIVITMVLSLAIAIIPAFG
jgi:hypothetical protein